MIAPTQTKSQELTRALGLRLQIGLMALLLAVLVVPLLGMVVRTTNASFGCVRAAFQTTQTTCPAP